MRVLLADSDSGFSNRIVSVLEKNVCDVDKVCNDTDCIAYAEFDIYDVIIIDALISKDGGLQLVRELRQNKVSTPIMYFLQSREIEERVNVLDSGADDCLCTPFSFDEFLARMRALARRKSMLLQFSLMSFSDITLNLNTNELICNEHIVHLGVKEFRIMKILISSGKNVSPKESLAEKVWGINSSAEYNTIEVYISFLRKKLKKLNSQVKINTIRNIGYILSSK